MKLETRSAVGPYANNEHVSKLRRYVTVLPSTYISDLLIHYSHKLSNSEKIAGPMLAERVVEVSNIYNRHKDEYTKCMACILR